MSSEHSQGHSRVPGVTAFVERRHGERRVSLAHRVQSMQEVPGEREALLRELLDDAHARIRTLETAFEALKGRI